MYVVTVGIQTPAVFLRFIVKSATDCKRAHYKGVIDRCLSVMQVYAHRLRIGPAIVLSLVPVTRMAACKVCAPQLPARNSLVRRA